jgi:hypothetical protein
MRNALLSFLTIPSALVFSFAFFSGVSAAGACKITSAPDEALEAYVRGVDSLVSAVLSEGTKGSCSTDADDSKRSGSSDVRRGTTKMLSSVNKAVTSENVFTSFRFTTDLIRRTDSTGMGYVRRDHALLASKQKRIESVFDAVYGRCGDIRKFETNVSPFPNFDTTGLGVGTVLETVLTNHVDVMKLYREAVIGNPPTVTTLALAPKSSDSFIASLQADYGPSGVEACNTTEAGSPFEKVKEAVDRIGKLGGEIQTGTQEWKNAFKLLNGENKQYARIERQLLSDELSKQGMSVKQSERTLNNLNDYNAGKGWQGVSSSLASVGDSVTRAVKTAESLYVEAEQTFAKSKNTDEYMERLKNLKEFKTDLAKELASEKEAALSLIGDDTVSVDNNVGQLLETHILLSKTLKSIAPAEQTSKEACNAQVNGQGNCRGE